MLEDSSTDVPPLVPPPVPPSAPALQYPTEVCHQVQVEPELQPVSNPDTCFTCYCQLQEGARLDIVMNGFWGGRSERCFVDVRVFNPYAQSNVNSISAAYRRHENIKRRAYGQRVREVEHASFTPIVMSATGGLAPEATTFYRRLASLLASRWGDDYSVVMGWLHCSLSFSLLRSAIAWCSFIYRTFSSCSTATWFSSGGVQHYYKFWWSLIIF